MSDQNVVQFPGEGNKASNMVAKSMAKGKKITQQQALGALMEMQQKFNGLVNTIGRLSQAQVQYENLLQRIDTNLGVLMSMFIDMGTFTEDDFQAAWDKYVIQPQEEALTKHIDELKKGSAEDAFYAEVINMVRNHEWEDREQGDQKATGKQVKDFYMQMLLNPQTRGQALADVRKELPDVPEMESAPEKDTAEVRQMPDCRYCGKEDCEFCNPPETE